MQSVKVFSLKQRLSAPIWATIISLLLQRGIEVHRKVQDCDVALILSGQFENPIPFKKRVLVYVEKERPDKLCFWRQLNHFPIIEKYYDGFLNLSGSTLGEAVDKIIAYIEKAKRE